MLRVAAIPQTLRLSENITFVIAYKSCAQRGFNGVCCSVVGLFSGSSPTSSELEPTFRPQSTCQSRFAGNDGFEWKANSRVRVLKSV